MKKFLFTVFLISGFGRLSQKRARSARVSTIISTLTSCAFLMCSFNCVTSILLLSSAPSLYAQSNSGSVSLNASQTSVSADEQWEYLIVSVTKFQLDLGEKEEPAQRKWLDRRTGSTGFFQEAEVQREFDRLGKLGWELTGVLPSSDNNGNFVYGSSKFIFKRRLNADRSQREAELVLAEEKERAQNLKKPVEIIDLDASESDAQRQEVKRRAETRLRQALQNVKEIPITIAKLQIFFASTNDKEPITEAELIVDGSRVLLKENNKYRASEARNYLRKVATGIFDTIGLKQTDPNREPFSPFGSYAGSGKVRISISVVVNSNGSTRTVAQGSINGDWAEVARLKNHKEVLNFVTFN